MMRENNGLDLQRFSPESEGGTTGENTPSDAGTEMSGDLSFEALLKEKPEYKAAYDARVKRAIEGRFRQMRQLEESHAKAAPVLRALAQRYGLSWQEGEDTQPLLDALSAPPQPSREERKSKLRDQVTAMRGRYPSFRLEQEMRNPIFGRLLAQGTPVEAAYRLAHQPDALAQAMGYAISRTRQALADQMRSGSRPPENAMTPRLSPQTAPDPRSLTPLERKNLRSRVAKGEKVYW